MDHLSNAYITKAKLYSPRSQNQSSSSKAVFNLKKKKTPKPDKKSNDNTLEINPDLNLVKKDEFNVKEDDIKFV